MNHSLSHDHKAKDLLSRIGHDISQLKGDVSSLLHHTGKHTISDSARDLADQARDRLHAGGAYAASQLRYVRQHPGQSSAGLLGGLLLLGAVGAGIYYLCKSDCSVGCRTRKDHSDDDENVSNTNQLPPYIS
ncbi:hypothetical protein ACFSSA_10095 [Luteolibacter algae]|uniref:DUF883 domain-containing protein n=1 Tax=Luteolibacter algae TaxID=454151 RepID=A0ABW5D8C6_9BACT